jgi:hypothetical protein
MAGRASGGKGVIKREDKSLVLVLDPVVCPKIGGVSAALPRREQMNSIETGKRDSHHHIFFPTHTYTR